jgi:hypothetical protein
LSPFYSAPSAVKHFQEVTKGGRQRRYSCEVATPELRFNVSSPAEVTKTGVAMRWRHPRAFATH